MTHLNSPKGYTRWWIEFFLPPPPRQCIIYGHAANISTSMRHSHILDKDTFVIMCISILSSLRKSTKWTSSSLRVQWYHISQLVISILTSPFMTNSSAGFPVKTTNNLLNDKVFSVPHFFSFFFLFLKGEVPFSFRVVGMPISRIYDSISFLSNCFTHQNSSTARAWWWRMHIAMCFINSSH